METADTFVLLAILVYFMVVLTIGFIYAKRSNSSTSEYFLGGRKVGPWFTALSAEASDMSGYLLMGLPGLAYFTGASDVGWTAIGLAAGTYLNWRFVAGRLRRYSVAANDSITLPGFYSNRFNDKKNTVGTIAAIIILIFFCVYCGSCFVTCGRLFNSLFGWDYSTMMVFGAVIVFLAECNNPDTIGGMPLFLKILNSLFESVTFRTAGFATFSQAGLTDVSCLAAYLMMFIGGSPIGTAGGVKTTTFYLAVLGVNAYIRGEGDAQVYKRSVSAEQMRKATVIIEVSVATVIVLTMLLVASNPVGIEDGLFEIISACATVGLTRDVTSTLNTAGKLIVTVGMYLGRIGPISMAIFFTGQKDGKKGIHYAEGNYFVG